jgi:ABC-type microcin C transport system permease subunit YejE
MAADKPNKQFDEMLSQSLRKYSVAVPDDFTAKVSRQIKDEKQRRLLAKVVLQERIALAGCVLLGIIAVVFAVIFPGINGIFIQISLVDEVSKAIEALYYKPQYYIMFLVAVLGFAVYGLIDLLVGDR